MPVFVITESNEVMLLTEANQIKGANSEIVRFYLHVLKWVYQQHKQSSNWVKTINASIDEINKDIREKGKINKNIINKINLREDYYSGISGAINDTKIKDLTDNYNGIEYVWENFKSLFPERDSIGILNKEKVQEFLLKHSFNKDSIRFAESYIKWGEYDEDNRKNNRI